MSKEVLEEFVTHYHEEMADIKFGQTDAAKARELAMGLRERLRSLAINAGLTPEEQLLFNQRAGLVILPQPPVMEDFEVRYTIAGPTDEVVVKQVEIPSFNQFLFAALEVSPTEFARAMKLADPLDRFIALASDYDHATAEFEAAVKELQEKVQKVLTSYYLEPAVQAQVVLLAPDPHTHFLKLSTLVNQLEAQYNEDGVTTR